MGIENDFLTLQKLLTENAGDKLVDDLVKTIEKFEVDFRANDNSLSKDHLLNVYTTRQLIQREINQDDFVDGYDETIQKLRTTDITEIDLISYNSDNGGFLVFTDKKRERLLGLLKTKRTLTEIRQKYSGQSGLDNQFQRKENLFIKGKLRRE